MKIYLLSISIFYYLVAASAALAATSSLSGHEKSDVSSQQMKRLKDKSSGAGTVFCSKANTEYELGRTSKNPQDRSNHFHRAEVFAQQAVVAEPQSDEGYKWLAIALGAQADDAKIRTQIELSRRVKENIDKALVLDPKDDISLLVLSRWQYKVASLGVWSRAVVRVVYGGLPAASMKKSEELLLKAIAIKDRISHRYCLAKVYNQMGRREDALRQLRLALTLPVTFPEEAEDLQKAKRKLVSWK